MDDPSDDRIERRVFDHKTDLRGGEFTRTEGRYFHSHYFSSSFIIHDSQRQCQNQGELFDASESLIRNYHNLANVTLSTTCATDPSSPDLS